MQAHNHKYLHFSGQGVAKLFSHTLKVSYDPPPQKTEVLTLYYVVKHWKTTAFTFPIFSCNLGVLQVLGKCLLN